MTYDKTYYVERKKELQNEYQAIINDTYSEMERLVIKKKNKEQELQKKLSEIEAKERESQEQEEKKTEAKNKKSPISEEKKN